MSTIHWVMVGACLWILALYVFLKWWAGIQRLNHQADETFRQYVNGKTFQESKRETRVEHYNKTKGAKNASL